MRDRTPGGTRLCAYIALLFVAFSLNAQTKVGSQPRAAAAVAQLSDGRLLLTGGSGPDGPLTTVDIYANGTVSSGPPMKEARSGHIAVSLLDGRVLVTGGRTTDGQATWSAEIYNPAKNVWTDAGDMLEPRSGHTATVLGDGRVLIAGGENALGALSSLELFNPATNTFTGAGILCCRRTHHAAALLLDGRVLIAGGWDGNKALDSVDIFDPTTSAVVQGPPLSVARDGHSATTLRNGNVLIVGGSDGIADLASAELYDSARGTFSLIPGVLSTPRRDHFAFYLPLTDGVLILRGTHDGRPLDSAELFEPARARFRQVDPRSGLVRRFGIPLNPAPGTSRLVIAPLIVGTATVTTDKPDYHPGETVIITGKGWLAGETVSLLIHEAPTIDPDRTLFATADLLGNFTNNQLTLEAHDVGVTFTVTATGQTSGQTAQTTFTDSAANLDQCTNGGVGATPEVCQAVNPPKDWVNGNANGTKAHWREGEFISYRDTISVSVAGTHVFQIHYDIVSSSQHAIDYLGSFDATETTGAGGTFHANNNNPCGDQLPAAQCNPASP